MIVRMMMIWRLDLFVTVSRNHPDIGLRSWKIEGRAMTWSLIVVIVTWSLWKPHVNWLEIEK